MDSIGKHIILFLLDTRLFVSEMYVQNISYYKLQGDEW